jgi:superfamily II DNA or RNA helicase
MMAAVAVAELRAAVAGVRPYQRLAQRAIEGRLARPPYRCHLALPTGTGKTRIAAEVARGWTTQGLRVLVIAHRRELVRQLGCEFQEAVGGAAGLVMGEISELTARLTVASLQSLRQPERLREYLAAGPPALVVIDEGHHATSGNSYGNLLADLLAESPGLRVLGLTATPYRLDGSPIEDVLGPCAFTRGLAEMVDGGWLAPLRWHGLRLSELRGLSWVPLSRTQAGRDFAERPLSRLMAQEAAVRAVAARTAGLIGDRSCLVFAVSVDHAEALARAYRREGLGAAALWGGMPEVSRVDVLGRWRRGDLQVVTNCQVLAEGFDFPELAALVVARPTMSPGLYLQMVGRVTRRAEGKADGLVIDVAGNDLADEARPVQLPDFGVSLAPGPRTAGAVRPDLSGRNVLWGDPFARSKLPWFRDPETGMHVATALGTGAVALVADQDGRGLWEAWLRLDQGSADMGPGRLHRLTDDPLPLGRAVATVDRFAVERRLRQAARKLAPWRKLPPTGSQLNWLGRLDPGLGGRATAEGWTRGQVSDWITVCGMRNAMGAREGVAMAPRERTWR